MFGFIVSTCLSATDLWCGAVVSCSIIPTVGLKLWNSLKYKLLKSFLPHSCSKYSKSQSNWNMGSTQPNKAPEERDFFLHLQKYKCSHNHPSATSFSWPASDRLISGNSNWRPCYRYMAAVVLSKLNIVGSGSSSFFCDLCLQAPGLHACRTQEEPLPLHISHEIWWLHPE